MCWRCKFTRSQYQHKISALMQNKGRQSTSTCHVTLPFNCEFVMAEIALSIPGGVRDLPACALHVQRPHMGLYRGNHIRSLAFHSPNTCSIFNTSQLMKEASDKFQELSNEPMASTPAAPFQAHALLTTIYSGWPTPVNIGTRRLASLRPQLS